MTSVKTKSTKKDIKQYTKKDTKQDIKQDSSRRYFKLIQIENDKLCVSGKYSGDTAKIAARKVFSSLTMNIVDDCCIMFGLLDVTMNSEFCGTIYVYIGQKEKLEKPLSVKINKGLPNEKTIELTHDSNVSILREKDCAPEYLERYCRIKNYKQ